MIFIIFQRKLFVWTSFKQDILLEMLAQKSCGFTELLDLIGKNIFCRKVFNYHHEPFELALDPSKEVSNFKSQQSTIHWCLSRLSLCSIRSAPSCAFHRSIFSQVCTDTIKDLDSTRGVPSCIWKGQYLGGSDSFKLRKFQTTLFSTTNCPIPNFAKAALKAQI